MFLRRSLVHISYMYMIFFCMSVHLGACPSPPYQKAGYATVASFRSPEEWPNEDGRFRPPPPPLATRNRRHCPQGREYFAFGARKKKIFLMHSLGKCRIWFPPNSMGARWWHRVHDKHVVSGIFIVLIRSERLWKWHTFPCLRKYYLPVYKVIYIAVL